MAVKHDKKFSCAKNFDRSLGTCLVFSYMYTVYTVPSEKKKQFPKYISVNNLKLEIKKISWPLFLPQKYAIILLL